MYNQLRIRNFKIIDLNKWQKRGNFEIKILFKITCLSLLKSKKLISIEYINIDYFNFLL